MHTSAFSLPPSRMTTRKRCSAWRISWFPGTRASGFIPYLAAITFTPESRSPKRCCCADMGLLEIAKLPTAENAALHLNAADNVAIARVPLAAGQTLRIDGREIVVEQPIPAGHKLALAPIETGAAVLRYGQVIGRARLRVEPGQHVHTHNLAFEELGFEYEFPVAEKPLPEPRRDAPTFLGYAREDGRA